jgi:nucleotide-binding universal stress UspA family protein
MHENILIPTDGSEQGEHAVRYAVDLAAAFDAKVHALYVVENKATYILTAGLSDEDMEEYRDYGEEVVSEIAERAADRGLDAKGVIQTGRISEEIVEYAEENDIDQIVMGKQGRGAIEKYVGSTAEKALRMSDIPVTVVGPGPQ